MTERACKEQRDKKIKKYGIVGVRSDECRFRRIFVRDPKRFRLLNLRQLITTANVLRNPWATNVALGFLVRV